MNRNCYNCCYPQMINPDACGCCEGVEIVTPLSTYNRPGLSEISYRIGTHGSFMETMIARLTAVKGLTTRNSDDPALAMLDAWATVADVLTFYQERIANEGYLRTATERRSVQELAKLTGYRPRPGVSSSVFLAYTLDDKHKEETVIPIGSRVQSIPGPDELPQAFEASENLKARSLWNNLKARMTRPQTVKTIENKEILQSSVIGPRVYLKGINTNLKPNDPLLIAIGDNRPVFSHVVEVIPDAVADHTLVKLQLKKVSDSALEQPESTSIEKTFNEVQLIKDLTESPSIQPRNTLQLERNLDKQFMSKANTGYEVAGAFTPTLKETLPAAVSNAAAAERITIKVYALRVKASLFGHNLPLPSCPDDVGPNDLSCCMPIRPPESCFKCVVRYARSLLKLNRRDQILSLKSMAFSAEDNPEAENILALDAEYKELKEDTWVAVENGNEAEVFKINKITTETLGGFLEEELGFFSTCPPITVTEDDSGSSAKSAGDPTKIKSTILMLDLRWRDPGANNDILRKAVFYGQSEELALAEEPIETPVCGGTEEDLIELDGFYEGLESGRWVIVSGERKIERTSGVRFSELAMLSAVVQKVVTETQVVGTDDVVAKMPKSNPRPGEKIHTFIKLASKLAYCFKRDTTTIYGNVVKATHGETHQEVLGSGDGSKALQSFDLKQKPLTYASVSNPSGVDSTLKVFVNDVQWHEADSLVALQPNDRRFISKTDNEDKTAVIFGNGKKGVRLPTGIENIRAEYRSGIGKQGNVKAEQISLLTTKPLGVKEVINPLRASGGANRETRDQARKNAPLAVKALDRLISVQDYEDFSRVYAGIGKAHAVELSDGRQKIVHVTIAGAEDIPIDDNSDLFQNLHHALHEFGDPHQVIRLAIRELMFIVIEAGVAILPDYQWEPVADNLRGHLLDTFSFERRELGQDVTLSEVISVMQSVRGVAYVDVNTFGGIPEKIASGRERRLLTPEEVSEAVACLAVRWSQDDMEKYCLEKSGDECEEFNKCKKYGHFDGTRGLRQKLQVNLAEFDEQKSIVRPAQIAFLTPAVSEMLILNQIK